MRTLLLRALLAAALGGLLAAARLPDPAACEYWVAPAPVGSDRNPGSADAPWATLDHASAQALALGGGGCTVWFHDGLYVGHNDLHERFATPTTFRAINPYRAILENNGQVIELSGARNITFEGFTIRHDRLDVSKLLIYVSQADGLWAEQITFRNNIIHDSYNNDLLKIHNGARHITVEGNIFFNQGPGEEHIDVNGVEDVLIQDNIFFNDFAGSGRDDGDDVHSFITIKDSTVNPGAEEGSHRITVRRNIFLNWEGRRDTFIQVGNDGKPYYEAVAIRIESNLLVGNAATPVYAALGVRGVRALTFANNTVVGDLPSSAYAFWVDTKDLNPPNREIAFYNNIWSDPTGTMGADGQSGAPKFSNGNPANTVELDLDNNLYWNGGAPIPAGTVASPLEHDRRRRVADPLLGAGEAALVLPRWEGTAFRSSSLTIRDEFVRLVEQFGALGAGSPAIDAADPARAPADDILGRPRGAAPDLGAYEYGAPEPDPAPVTPAPSSPSFYVYLPRVVTP